jgi:hypothetical protein
VRSEIGFGEAGDFHLMAEKAEFERRVTMDGDGDAFNVAGFGEDVMAAVGPLV